MILGTTITCIIITDVLLERKGPVTKNSQWMDRLHGKMYRYFSKNIYALFLDVPSYDKAKEIRKKSIFYLMILGMIWEKIGGEIFPKSSAIVKKLFFCPIFFVQIIAWDLQK